MATIVYQGLQSCLDSPQLVEQRTLRLKLPSLLSPHFSQPFDLSSLKSCFPDAKTNESAEKCNSGDSIKEPLNHHHEDQSSKNTEMGGWSFLQSLSNCSQSSKLDKEKAYVHPLVKRKSSSLSEKSLKICTENLGNETGTDMSESGILSNTSCAGSKSENFSRQQRLAARKMKSPTSALDFPPPLTTMSGAESLQVRPHREEGRLVIRAVKTPSRSSCFHAERSHGRLRLSFLENYTPTFDLGERVTEEENESHENDMSETEGEEEEEEEVVEIEEDEKVKEKELQEEVDEKKMEVEGKMGIENFERPNMRRCKEDGHENENKALMLNWEPFWVATS